MMHKNFKLQTEGVHCMKRIFSLIFISIFALAFSAGFVACKKAEKTDEPAVEEQKAEEAAPAEKEGEAK
jgi:hypothetical protein